MREKIRIQKKPLHLTLREKSFLLRNVDALRPSSAKIIRVRPTRLKFPLIANHLGSELKRWLTLFHGKERQFHSSRRLISPPPCFRDGNLMRIRRKRFVTAQFR